MLFRTRSFIYSTLLLLSAVAVIVIASFSTASAQTSQTNLPVFKDYRGVQIGMSADEVRKKLDRLKDGGLGQDFFAYSEGESAQIYYDKDRKVIAVSVDYFGGDANAPSASAVLGEELQAKPDGSMYQLKRYPEAGYWVSYNRTAGDKPVITITMQKI